MHPILYGPIHWYGVMLALAFLAGLFYAVRTAKKESINPDYIYDLAIWIMASAMIGARILFVLSDPSYFWEHPAEIIFSRSGFSSYGGYILATIVGLWFARQRKIPMWKLADVIVPAVCLGEAIGRIGCFLNGCCYGRVCNVEFVPWAVKFPYLDGAKIDNPLYRHPTQIYQSIFALLIFGLLVSSNKRKKFDGETFWLYLIIASAVRFIIDIYREPGQDMMFSMLTLAQLISILIFAFSLGILIRFRSLRIHQGK